MSGRAPPMPGWMLLFVVPAVVISLWLVGGPLGDIALLFVVSGVLAMLLNPAVRAMTRAHIPRPVGVVLLVLVAVAVVGGTIYLIIDPARSQVSDIRRNLPAYTAEATNRAGELQAFLARHGIHVDLRERVAHWVPALRDWLSHQTGRALSYGLDALAAVIGLILVIVAAIYMLLDARRIARLLDRVMPGAAIFLSRTERRLGRYLRAQILISLIIGLTVGLTMWVYGVTGIFPAGSDYAIAFGVWAFFMEFIPYVGPVLEALPPVILALFSESFLTALWVVVAFLVIQQLEGHIVVPKIMGNAAGVHPLVVIFGLLLGDALFGPVGILLALPVVVILREATVFLWERRMADRPAPGLPDLPAPPGPRGGGGGGS